MAGGRGRSPPPHSPTPRLDKRCRSRGDDNARSDDASPKRRKSHHHLQNSIAGSMIVINSGKAENKHNSQVLVVIDKANITVGKPPAASISTTGRPPIASAAAGIQKSGKPDGLRNETNVHPDNWDDAEGYYAYRFGELLGGRYEITAAHGKGVFSRVVGAKDLEAATGDAPERVAIKIIRNNDTMYRSGKQEVSILQRLNGADCDDRHHCVRFVSSFRCMCNDASQAQISALLVHVPRFPMPLIQISACTWIQCLYNSNDKFVVKMRLAGTKGARMIFKHIIEKLPNRKSSDKFVVKVRLAGTKGAQMIFKHIIEKLPNRKENGSMTTISTTISRL